MLVKILKNFCSNTKLHGFAYIVQPQRHKTERILWFLSLFISFTLTGILIRKLVLESQKNPTVIYTDQNIVKIDDLNFPAVSICPGLIYRTACDKIIDYDLIKLQLENHEQNISDFHFNELKLLQVASLVARDGFLSKNFPSLSIPTDDLMDKFYEFNLTFTKFYYYREFTKIIRPISGPPPSNFIGHYANQYAVYLKHFVSENGPCFTFNSPELKKLYHQKVYVSKSYFLDLQLPFNIKMLNRYFYRTNNFLCEADTELFTYYQPRGTVTGKWKQCSNISYPVRANKDGLVLGVTAHMRDCNLRDEGNFFFMIY